MVFTQKMQKGPNLKLCGKSYKKFCGTLWKTYLQRIFQEKKVSVKGDANQPHTTGSVGLGNPEWKYLW